MLNQSEALQHLNSNLCWLSTFASCSLKSAKDEATASPDAAAQISLRDSSMEGSSQLNIHFFKLSVLKNKFTAQTSFLGGKKKKAFTCSASGHLVGRWSKSDLGPACTSRKPLALVKCLHQQTQICFFSSDPPRLVLTGLSSFKCCCGSFSHGQS